MDQAGGKVINHRYGNVSSRIYDLVIGGIDRIYLARFSSSTNGIGRRARTATINHWMFVRDVVLNMICRAGNVITAHCSAIHNSTLNKSFLFEKNPI